MARFKEIETRLKKKLRPNVPTASDRPGWTRMVRAREDGREKLIYFGKKSLKEGLKNPEASIRTEATLKCDRPMSKLTREYWECQDLAPRQEKSVQKFKKAKNIAVQKKKDIR